MAAHRNHLAYQTSPYLLQHVENPVDWYPWSQESLKKAEEEQKPILLSIGYSTCHWCHVMAHESFENDDVARIINENFIAIKVDREERPDLDQIYMTAVTSMTGQGGWPLTVFLTPQTKPFFGGTYFPPYAKWGNPGFIDLLNTIVNAWINQKEEILMSSETITQALLEQTQKFCMDSKIPDESLLETASIELANQFDSQNGGFGGAPKFPMGHYLSFLLRSYKRKQDFKILLIVQTTLTVIAKGGIYDHLGGGFHRYSTDAHWHVPHFEKMLYDQALLVKAYLEGYQITGNLQFATVAKETLEYVLRDLQDAQGGFYCAEDADSLESISGHKIEGAFYVWSKKELLSTLTEDEASLFNHAFGIQDNGNAANDPHGEFTGKNILYLAHTIEDIAHHFNKSTQEVSDTLKNAKQKLFELRKLRSRPHLDDKILTDWNGLMIGTLAFAGSVLNEDRYTNAARKTADFILMNLRNKNRLLHSWREGPSDIPGTLEDYGFFINGLLDLYEITLEEKYFSEAKSLALDMLVLFEDQASGGFFLTGTDAEQLIIRTKDLYDGAIPSGNSAAAYLLVRLYLITSDHKWLSPVEKLFKTFGDAIKKNPSAYTFALCAFDFYIGPSFNIVLEGQTGDRMLKQMQALIYKHFIPNKTIVYKSSDSLTNASVCYKNVCHPPTNDMSTLEQQLLVS
ncbi:MAG: thioredoxin domain-containing protein [Candidatus Omnitrophica bacterium]|nr:thioredoxin domain-containing protein [Candidatus Omnitrophota bacterium]